MSVQIHQGNSYGMAIVYPERRERRPIPNDFGKDDEVVIEGRLASTDRGELATFRTTLRDMGGKCRSVSMDTSWIVTEEYRRLCAELDADETVEDDDSTRTLFDISIDGIAATLVACGTVAIEGDATLILAHNKPGSNDICEDAPEVIYMSIDSIRSSGSVPAEWRHGVRMYNTSVAKTVADLVDNRDRDTRPMFRNERVKHRVEGQINRTDSRDGMWRVTDMVASFSPLENGGMRCIVTLENLIEDEVCDITLPAGFTVFDMFRAIYDCIGEEWTDPANISAIDGKWIFGKI